MPKLPRGMYRRGRAFYCRLFEDGRELRRSLGTDYEEACRGLRGLRHGEPAQRGPRVTVAEAVERWLATAVRNGRNAQGIRDATSRASRYLVASLGYRAVRSVRAEHLREFRVWLEEEGCSVSLVHHVLTDTRGFFRWCEAAELVARAPVPPRWLPRLAERAPDRLSEEEVRAVCTVPEPYGFIVRLALGTGLRWGELTRLEAGDIWNGVVVVKQSKSGKVRRVPLPNTLIEEVAGRSGRLVPLARADSVTRQVRQLSRVRHFHMHQTRHTYACRYLERGGSLHALQQLLGHSTVLVTQRYARLSDDAVLAEHRRLESEDLLRGQTGTETGTPPTGQHVTRCAKKLR